MKGTGLPAVAAATQIWTCSRPPPFSSVVGHVVSRVVIGVLTRVKDVDPVSDGSLEHRVQHGVVLADARSRQAAGGGQRAWIVGCLVKGMSIRSTVGVTGAAKNTVVKLGLTVEQIRGLSDFRNSVMHAVLDPAGDDGDRLEGLLSYTGLIARLLDSIEINT